MSILQVQIKTNDPKVAPAQALVNAGPTISVLVGQPPLPDEPTTDQPKLEQVIALIDTGATTSCIDEKFATDLGLTVIDEQTAHGIGGPKLHSRFLVFMQVPELSTHKTGNFLGVDLKGRQPVLLGRDFLSDIPQMTSKFVEIVPLVHSQGNSILPQPSDGPILEIGSRPEGHLPRFSALQTHPSCRVLLAVDSLGLRRSGSSP